MTTVAVLADIHGNLPALEAVLADLALQRPDEILVGGDLVGRGPEGSRVVHAIAERGWPCVRGNHEDYLLQFRRREVPPAWLRAEEWAAARWMAAELDSESEIYIDSLPFSLAAGSAPGLLLIHGTPESHGKGLGPWTSDRELERQLAAIDGKLLVCGHTHRPMDRSVPSGRVVNVGSVGLPFNQDRRAQYAVFHLEGGRWQVEFRQVEYDLNRILEVYESSGFRAAGGVTARLLMLELEHAAPFLVPFQMWAEASGARPRPELIDDFLGVYDPSRSLRAQLDAL